MGQQVGFLSNGRDAADRIRLEIEEREYRTRKAARREAGMRERSDRLRPLIVDTHRGIEQMQRIRETLARIELTDGLSFADLIHERGGRIPRDSTVIALLPGVPDATAIALGSLCRRGLAVSAILILIDENELPQAQGRLLAQGVRDIRHLRSEGDLPTLCQHQLERGGPYQLAMDY
jgi:hypothetical protein